VINDTYVNEIEGRFQAMSDQLVGVRRFSAIGGMIVAQDDCSRIMAQSGFDHFPRMDTRPIDGAAKHLLAGDQAMALIDKQKTKDLILKIGKS